MAKTIQSGGGTGGDSNSTNVVAGKAPLGDFEFAVSSNPQFNNELRVGLMAEVFRGDEKGAYGSVEGIVDAYSDGIPKTVLIRKRDDSSETVPVLYKDCKPAATRPR